MPRGAEAAWAVGERAQGIMLLCSSVAVPVTPDEVMVTQPAEKRKREGNPLQE